MAQFAFGSGILWGTPLQDAAGTAITNPTPVQFGTLQDASFDFACDLKELFGQNQFAVAIGRGKGKLTGKAKFAQLNGLLINSLFFGQTMSTGLIADYYDTTGSAIPSVSAYTITPTPPSSGTWAADLGVRDSNGLPMVRVAASPATGQYTVSNVGLYTFSSADSSATVFISFQYTTTSTSARKSVVQNVAMGYAPSFKVDFMMPYAGKTLTISWPNAISTKLSFATKLDDFMVPEFDFSGFADASGTVMTYSLSDR